MQATVPVPAPTRAQKVRFGIALAAFALWVAALAGMAFTSGHAPRAATPRPAAAP